jgi:hypothetical protein
LIDFRFTGGIDLAWWRLVDRHHYVSNPLPRADHQGI